MWLACRRSRLAAPHVCVCAAADSKDLDTVKAYLETVTLPEFRPKKVRIKADENDKVEEGGDDDADAVKAGCQTLVNIPQADRDAMHLSPISFEKV